MNPSLIRPSPTLSCPSQADLGVAALPVVLIFCIPLVVQSSSLSSFFQLVTEETSAHTGAEIGGYTLCGVNADEGTHICVQIYNQEMRELNA